MTAIAFRSNAAVIRAALRDAPRLPPGGACAGDCGKQRYATQQAALWVLHVCQWYGTRRDKTETRAYYSEPCGWWHLTSKDDYHATRTERTGERIEH